MRQNRGEVERTQHWFFRSLHFRFFLISFQKSLWTSCSISLRAGRFGARIADFVVDVEYDNDDDDDDDDDDDTLDASICVRCLSLP